MLSLILFSPVHNCLLSFSGLGFYVTELSTVFFMFVNSDIIVNETEIIPHIELQLNAFHHKENLKYHGNVYHSNIRTDPSGGTNSWISR